MKKSVEGVFLLLDTEEEEMIFVEEKNESNRSWKKDGQFFVPAGTREAGEEIEETIERELREETGLNGKSDIVEKTLEKIGVLFLETDTYKIEANVYKGNVPLDTKIKVEKFNTYEINGITVAHPINMITKEIKKIRPGLIEALLLKEGIQSSDIIHIENGTYKDTNGTIEKINKLQVLYKKRLCS